MVLAVFAIGLAAAGGGVEREAGEMRNATDQLTLDDQTASTLEHADEWTYLVENETVTTSDGAALERGEDYAIDYQNGTLTAASATYDGATVTVEYWYQWHDETTRGILALFGPAIPLVGVLLLIGAVGAIFGWLGWF